ncbi:MAG: hypothetical protein KDD25_06000, partial [Bdellovibrionales bacterium]|nr:hypothetical protein [Bdellovibrionales bacterium]
VQLGGGGGIWEGVGTFRIGYQISHTKSIDWGVEGTSQLHYFIFSDGSGWSFEIMPGFYLDW